jgi:hypothetical protein
MNTALAVERAGEWARSFVGRTPGCAGAHLVGSLAGAPPQDPFPRYRDVNIHLVMEGARSRQTHATLYQGLILEYSLVPATEYRSPAAVLSRADLAAGLAVGGILADSSGRLEALHHTVAPEYPRRHWIMARSEEQKDAILQSLADTALAASPQEAHLHLSSAVQRMAGLLAVAALQPPTHRRALLVAGELLADWGKEALRGEMLGVLGYAHIDRAQAEAALGDCAATFDRAVQVHRTPVPLGFKLNSYVRPHLVQGAWEMIYGGHHREAMHWILTFLLIANQAIQLDAPEAERPAHQARVDRWLRAAGWPAPGTLGPRLQRARLLAADVFRTADEMVGQNR